MCVRVLFWVRSRNVYDCEFRGIWPQSDWIWARVAQPFGFVGRDCLVSKCWFSFVFVLFCFYLGNGIVGSKNARCKGIWDFLDPFAICLRGRSQKWLFASRVVILFFYVRSMTKKLLRRYRKYPAFPSVVGVPVSGDDSSHASSYS